MGAINLDNMGGADSTSWSAEPGSNNLDNFVYNVDLSLGETVTLTGNWGSVGGADGPAGSGNYFVAYGAPSFGTFSLDNASGVMSWTFNYDDVVNAGAMGGSHVFGVQGTDAGGLYDTDRVTVNITCFLAGTLISTPSGPRAVETLASGDLVLSIDGRAIPVKWMGRQTVASLFVHEDQAPVRIAAGALAGVLGANLPARDLKLTADHALLIGGVMVQAGALVNGSTIRSMTPAELGERYTVRHIETEGHEVIVAEGCAAETFVDNATRRGFDNYAEYEALFGEEQSIEELDMPRVKSARQLPASLRGALVMREAA